MGQPPVSQSHHYHPAVCRCPSPGRPHAPPPLGWGERWLVGLEAVPGPPSQVRSLASFSPHLPVGPPSHRQPRHSRLPQGPRAQTRWSLLPSRRSCWPSSSPPSSPCSSTPGKWTGSGLPWEGWSPCPGPPLSLPHAPAQAPSPACSAGRVFPEGRTGVTIVDQGIPKVLEPLGGGCVCINPSLSCPSA